MASITSVSVLAPNGRRQIVKVTSNTTILQILEEVCKKQGFKSESFELRHQNRPLDLTAVIRFSGLSNMASLEMAEAAQARTETAVSLVLQLESGARVNGDFMPTASLWDVLVALAPDGQRANAALVYLRREVSGQEALERTTLRDLGLVGGRAMIRLVAAASDGPRKQANVSAPLGRPPATVATAMEVDEPAPPSMQRTETGTVDSAQERQRQQAVLTQEQQRQQAAVAQERERKQAALAQEQQRQQAVVVQEQQRQQAAVALERERQQAAVALEQQRQQAQAALAEERERQQAVAALEEERKQAQAALEQQIVVVGERDAVVFRAESSHADLDLPDCFFETTVEDARVLYRDLKAKAASLADAPLQTSAQRLLSETALSAPSVVRVRFPDRTVLQGTFHAGERVSDVEAFVRSQLREPRTPFTLFTTPPRLDLPPDATLLDVGCARSCLMHFAPAAAAADAGTGTSTGFLRAEPMTSAAGAALLASRVRGVLPPAATTTASRPAAARATGHAPSPGHAPSSSHAPSHGHAPSSAGPAPLGRVPKWFKPA